jgi:hypothetical protein
VPRPLNLSGLAAVGIEAAKPVDCTSTAGASSSAASSHPPARPSFCLPTASSICVYCLSAHPSDHPAIHHPPSNHSTTPDLTSPTVEGGQPQPRQQPLVHPFSIAVARTPNRHPLVSLLFSSLFCSPGTSCGLRFSIPGHVLQPQASNAASIHIETIHARHRSRFASSRVFVVVPYTHMPLRLVYTADSVPA